MIRAGQAPTPFTAYEIRQACPAGRTLTARTEAAGEPDRVDVTIFVETDEKGALVESNGQRHRVTWQELQNHASFPAEMTTIHDDVVEGPLGRLDCLSYRVVADDTVSTFWFEKGRPGMPVLFTTEVDGALVSTTMVIADEIGD